MLTYGSNIVLNFAPPQVMLQTLWFLNTQHCVTRAQQEHYRMKMEFFWAGRSDDGDVFIEFHEDPTKTRGSGLQPGRRPALPKMFATGDERCPVRLFQLFMSKRPVELRATGPFYLAVKQSARKEDDIWFMKSNLGKNQISSFMKSIISGTSAETSGKKITNHSGRKTTIKKLKSAQVSEDSIIKITGHKSTKRLQPYNEGDEVEFHAMSNEIDNVQAPHQPRALSTHIRCSTAAVPIQLSSTGSSVYGISTDDAIIQLPYKGLCCSCAICISSIAELSTWAIWISFP